LSKTIALQQAQLAMQAQQAQLTNQTQLALQAQVATQAQQLADQSKQINDLRDMLNDLCTNGCAGFNPNGNIQPQAQNVALYQSVPNPASGSVSIGYLISMPYTSASINIVTVDDKPISSYVISSQGSGSISFDASKVAAGTYKYYLIIDGKIIATKSMAITKD